MRNFIAVTFGLSLAASTALAGSTGALLTDIEGLAYIKANGSLSEAETGAFVLQGQEVLVSMESTANLMMDGCAVVLEPGTRFVVPYAAPCANGEIFKVGGVQITPANGGGVYGPDAVVAGSQSGFGGFGFGTIAIATFGTVGAAVLTFKLLEKDAASPN